MRQVSISYELNDGTIIMVSKFNPKDPLFTIGATGNLNGKLYETKTLPFEEAAEYLAELNGEFKDDSAIRSSISHVYRCQLYSMYSQDLFK